MNTTIQAKPNLNGNAPKDFSEAGRALYNAATDAGVTMRTHLNETLHERNYQHNPEARTKDLERVAAIHYALVDLEKLALEMYDLGT